MAPKAAPKVKKAMNKPPAEATRSHDAYPGEHLGSKASSSRNHATDIFEGIEPDLEPKPSDSKAAKTKKSKTTAASNHTKPSKVDGRPVETEKTQPGGDMVEVEPKKRGRPRKDKASKRDQNALREPAGLAKESRERPNKAHDGEPDVGDNEMPDVGDGEDVAVEATTSPKTKKNNRVEAKGEPSKASTKSKAKTTKSNKADLKGHNPKAEDVEGGLSAPRPGKKAVKPKKAPKGGDDKAGQPGEVSADEEATTVPSKKSKKAKASTDEDGSETKGADIAPGKAMDDSIFDSLLSSDKGKQLVDEGSAPSGKPSSRKTGEKASKPKAQDGHLSKSGSKVARKGKDEATSIGEKEASISKSKKRKSAPEGDVDAVKTDLLDPLTEATLVKKKQRKSGSSTLEAAGGSLGSLLSSVKKNAKAAIDFAGSVAGGGQSSIMDDVEGVAEGALVEKDKKKKGIKASQDQVPSEEALLKGLESSGDERDADEDEGFDQGQVPPPLPKSTFDKINAIPHAETNIKLEGGVVYVGRIPHGFYEHEMRAYFSQFGTINRLRLSRNKTTGASRHYAFIEFESDEVAKIVAETMNNYLLFGHILKVKSLDPSQLHPNIWKGANRRFKKVPWAQIEGRKLAMPMSREQWEKRVEGEQKRRKDKAEKLKEIGYEFDAPLKSVDSVPVREGEPAIEGGEEVLVEAEKTLVTEPGEEGSSMVIRESTVTKKVRKPSAKAKEIESSKEVTATAGKKGKRKVEEVLEKAKESTDVTEPVSKKAKKTKAKAEEAANDAMGKLKDTAVPTVEKAKKTGEKAIGKAKESLDETAPIAKKAKKKAEGGIEKAKETTEDAAAPAAKQSKKAAQDAAENVTDSTEALTGASKKSKKSKA